MLKILGFRKNQGPEIRPYLGINSGPTPFGEGGEAFADVSHQYRQLGVESIRTEDLSNGSFDVMYFFPDRNADAADPANYDWTETDINYRDILATGANPFVRLGQSWRNMPSWGAFNLQEPTGYPGYGPFWRGDRPLSTTMMESGVEMFTMLIDRYTDEDLWGYNPLAEGYIEIWNEPQIIGINTVLRSPDGKNKTNPANTSEFEYSPEFPSYSWDGTPQEFYKFFADTAIRLKEIFPEVKIGGPGLQNVGLGLPSVQAPGSNYKNIIGFEWTENFLDYLAKRSVELDFFSWHLYDSDPENFISLYQRTEELLGDYGFVDTVQILSEWNTDFANPKGNVSTALGAAQVNAIWIALQHRAPNLALSHFYRGADGPFVPGGNGFPILINDQGENVSVTNFGDYGVGLLTSEGSYKANAHAFSYWSNMARRELVSIDQFYSVPIDQKGLYSLAGLQAGSDGRDLQVLISYLSDGSDQQDDVVLDVYELTESFGMAEDSVVITVLSEAFGPPLQVPLDEDGMLTLPSNQVVSIQMADELIADKIFYEVEDLSVDVGSFVASQLSSWEIVGGVDKSHFDIDYLTGHLYFVEKPEFDHPKDHDGDNIYSIVVEATSIHEVACQEVFIEVVDTMQSFSLGIGPSENFV